jgi:hypothetical protein
MASLFEKTKAPGRKYLYRGVEHPDYFSSMLGRGSRPRQNYVADFSEGVYFSPDYEVAASYAGSSGVVMIHAWDGPEDLSLRLLQGVAWERAVKWSISWNNQRYSGPPIPQYEPCEDFLEGPVSDNLPQIWSCSTPIPCPDEWQLVAKTPRACEYMSRKLLGVVYMEGEALWSLIYFRCRNPG